MIVMNNLLRLAVPDPYWSHLNENKTAFTIISVLQHVLTCMPQTFGC